MLGALIQTLVSVVVGVKLIRVWTRTHALPELLIGVAFFLTGGGYGGMITVRLAANANTTLTPPLAAIATISMLALGIGCWASGAFVVKVFRPGVLPTVLATLPGAVFIAVALVPNLAQTFDVQQVVSISAVVLFAWMSGEAIRYLAKLRRQRRILGLSDPLSENQMLLWAIATGCAALSSVLSFVGARYDVLAAILPWNSAITLCNGVCMLLSFAPPRAYTDWIKRRSQEEATHG